MSRRGRGRASATHPRPSFESTWICPRRKSPVCAAKACSHDGGTLSDLHGAHVTDTLSTAATRLPKHLARRLRLPLIAAPMLHVSGPDLVVAACKAGVIGAFPTL